MIEELFSQGQARLALQVVSSLLERDVQFNADPKGLLQLENHVWPALESLYGDHTVRVLSFGCSSGQETYSLAMQFDKCRDRFPHLKLEITGIDYPSSALARAQRGQYTHFEVQRGLPIRDLITYFDRRGEDWVVKPSLREQVSFREHHLMSNLSGLGHFHLIVFRNRLASYAPAAQVRILRGLSSIIPPLGYLMLAFDEKMPKTGYGFDGVTNIPGIFQRRAPVEPADTAENPAIEELQAQRLTMLEKEVLQRKKA